MDDKEKLVQAKKNYTAFLSKLAGIATPPLFQDTVIITKNNKTIVTDYWNEYDISPTKFYQWLNQQQKYLVIEEVQLDKKLFNRLTSMLYDIQYFNKFSIILNNVCVTFIRNGIADTKND
jgi:hypothetical protein